MSNDSAHQQETSDYAETYRVVLNDEGRHSIWPDYRPIPWGWRAEGTVGSRQACLDHIGRVWTDMRPLSLQRAMSSQQDTPVQQDTSGLSATSP